MKKGYVILEIIVSVTCIMILTLPIVKTIGMINNDKKTYADNRDIISVMDMSQQYIQEATQEVDILGDNKINGYDVNIIQDKKISEKLYKYKVVISENSDKRAEFYIIKRYE